tara:strand:+ start:139460 stop:140845 length:1386 start_codon:yes stop_codon:yes gene_type:complete
MSSNKNFFLDVLALLEGKDPISAMNSPAHRFLLQMGYPLPNVHGPTAHGPTAHEPALNVYDGAVGADLGNIRVILQLASRLERLFELPHPDAVGATFWGGLVSAHAVPKDRHDNHLVGVGGRGVTPRQAFESCIGEAAEFLSFIERENEPLIEPSTPVSGLSESNLSWSLAGIGMSSTTPIENLDWIEATSMRDGRKVYFPSKLVLRDSSAQKASKYQAGSAGVSAGPTIDRAIASGLMEVLERDAISLWWYGGKAARRIPDDFIQSTGIAQFTDLVRPKTDRCHWFLDLTTDIGVASVAAISSLAGGTAVVAGFSSRPDIKEAMKSAFLEMCQMELAQEIALYKQQTKQKLSGQDLLWIQRADELTIDRFPRLLGEQHDAPQNLIGKDGSIAALTKQLANFGFEPFFVNLTRDDVRLPVVKVLVPGLQTTKIDWLTKRLGQVMKKNNIQPIGVSGLIAPI